MLAALPYERLISPHISRQQVVSVPAMFLLQKLAAASAEVEFGSATSK